MTREEAIQFLDNMKHAEAGRAIGKEGFYAELLGYHIQALTMAIKALEQQTCEDAVSREAVLMELDKYLCGVPFDEKGIDEVIKELPSVNPQHTEDEIQKMQDLEQAELEKAYELGKAEQPKTGHWIDCGSYYRCSECDNWVDEVDGMPKFCDECGAKMVEPQESEG